MELPYHFFHRGTSTSGLFYAWTLHRDDPSQRCEFRWPCYPNPWFDLFQYMQLMLASLPIAGQCSLIPTIRVKTVNHTRALVIRHSETVICTQSPHTWTHYHEYQHFQLVWEPQISDCKSTCQTLVHKFIHNQQLWLVISTIPLKKLSWSTDFLYFTLQTKNTYNELVTDKRTLRIEWNLYVMSYAFREHDSRYHTLTIH